MYQILSQSVRFCRLYIKTILVCFFRLTVLTAVHLQNANAEFYKVGWKHYSGEAKNVYIFVCQIFSGQYSTKLVTIGQVL